MPGYVYDFAQGSKEMRDLLGGKGAKLAEMTSIGLPVPDGFTITTEACRTTWAPAATWPDGLRDAGVRAPREPRGTRGEAARRPDDPLLVSVRSGAPVSMPGMMDTILNLGLNDRSVRGPRRRQPATSASRSTPTAGSCRCSATW